MLGEKNFGPAPENVVWCNRPLTILHTDIVNGTKPRKCSLSSLKPGAW
jgi:hypothetical protein